MSRCVLSCIEFMSVVFTLFPNIAIISVISVVFLGKRDAANFLPAFMCSLLCVYILVREGLPSPAQSTPCVCNPCQLSPQSNLSTTISWDVTRTCVCECVCMCPGRWGWCQTESINCSPSVCAAQCVCVRVCEPLIPCIPAPSLFLWICIHIWCVYICICAFSAIFYFILVTRTAGFPHADFVMGENTPFFFLFFVLFWFLSGCGIPAPDFPFLHAWKPSYLPTSPLNPFHPTPRTSPLQSHSPAPRKRSLSWGRELQQDPLFTLGWRIARIDGTKKREKTGCTLLFSRLEREGEEKNKTKDNLLLNVSSFEEIDRASG